MTSVSYCNSHVDVNCIEVNAEVNGAEPQCSALPQFTLRDFCTVFERQECESRTAASIDQLKGKSGLVTKGEIFCKCKNPVA